MGVEEGPGYGVWGLELVLGRISGDHDSIVRVWYVITCKVLKYILRRRNGVVFRRKLLILLRKIFREATAGFSGGVGFVLPHS